jgi:hypothetical protein
MVTSRAVAEIIVDKVMATARLACELGAVRNVLTDPSIWLDDLLEAAIADAFVVPHVLTSGFCVVGTLAMPSTGINLAVVHV